LFVFDIENTSILSTFLSQQEIKINIENRGIDCHAGKRCGDHPVAFAYSSQV
jgi:hypothetical protein